jgi:hypothetical protein
VCVYLVPELQECSPNHPSPHLSFPTTYPIYHAWCGDPSSPPTYPQYSTVPRSNISSTSPHSTELTGGNCLSQPDTNVVALTNTSIAANNLYNMLVYRVRQADNLENLF